MVTGVVMQPSWARLSSDSARAGSLTARLGSARDNFESVRIPRNSPNELRAKISLKKYHRLTFVKGWFYHWVKKVIYLIGEILRWNLCILKTFSSVICWFRKNESSSGLARILKAASSARLGNFQLGSGSAQLAKFQLDCITSNYHE